MSTGRQKFQKYKHYIIFVSRFFNFFGYRFNAVLFSLLRNAGGLFGALLRYIFLRNIVAKCGDNILIGSGVYIYNPKGLSIGNNVSIHPMCYIDAVGGVSLEDNVSIAHASTILSSNHQWNDKSLPIKYNSLVLAPVYIESDVWVGCGVRILAGTRIYSRSVVAAGAVVNTDVLSNSVFGGVPAKLIKTL